MKSARVALVTEGAAFRRIRAHAHGTARDDDGPLACPLLGIISM